MSGFPELPPAVRIQPKYVNVVPPKDDNPLNFDPDSDLVHCPRLHNEEDAELECCVKLDPCNRHRRSFDCERAERNVESKSLREDQAATKIR